MRLLKLTNGQFNLVNFPDGQIPPYAILSHTWGNGEVDEVTLRDIIDGTGKNKKGYRKLQFCGVQATNDDLHYFWVDTCCIDKSNEKELTKSINSMFKWYRNAGRCYVYLSDVEVRAQDGHAHIEWESAFRNSRWFTRGWTLQELLAPGTVVFYSCDGVRLGDRLSLEQKIHEITKIAHTALQGRPPTEFSVQERLQWKGIRSTTEDEDIAYCLLGIFDVSMPLIYGEGSEKAMDRLFREIEWSGQSRPKASAVQSHWTVPFGRNKDFVGREDMLEQLLKVLPPTADKDDCQRTVIEGLGGIGKTQIALEASYRLHTMYPDCSVFWVPAVDAVTFENAYREIGRELKVQGIEEGNADVGLLVKNALSQTACNWLLVIDNIDDIELLFGNAETASLFKYLPFNRNGSILFTTRNHEISIQLGVSNTSILVATKMERDIALKMLQRYLKESQTNDTELTDKLLDFLDDLPLAIRQASAYMARTGMSTARYFQHCQSSDLRTIKLLSNDFEDRGRYENIKNPVALTWLISFNQISRDNQLAAHYLTFMCILAGKEIPVTILPPADDSLEAIGDDELERDEAIGILKAYGFIKEHTESSSFDMHRLVRLATRNWLKQGNKWDSCITWVMRRLADVYPSPCYENRDLWMKYLPHAWTDFDSANTLWDTEATGELLSNIGSSLRQLGKYRDSWTIYQQSFKLRNKRLGKNHPDTIASMNDLAVILRYQGKYREAEEMHQQTFGLSERVLGAKHPSTLSCMNDLAESAYRLGKLEEAMQIHQKTLKLREEVLGKEHVSTLGSLNNLANALGHVGKYGEAEQIHREHWKLSEKVLGRKHPETLNSMHNLAVTLGDLGRYQDAEKMHRDEWKLTENIWGQRHPSTLTSMYNFAVALRRVGKYSKAEQMHREVWKLSEQTLGREHPHTLENMNGLAIVLRRMGNYEEAIHIQAQALEGNKRILGKEHPVTLVSMDTFALLLYCQGKYDEAEQMHQQVFTLRKEILGNEHPKTLASMYNLAEVLYSKGKYERAEEMHRQTLERREKVLGSQHPDTISSRNKFAEILRVKRDGQS